MDKTKQKKLIIKRGIEEEGDYIWYYFDCHVCEPNCKMRFLNETAMLRAAEAHRRFVHNIKS